MTRYAFERGNTIYIDVTALITGDGANSLIDGTSAWQLIVSGIENTWSGNYWVNGKKVGVQVNVTAYFDEDKKYLDNNSFGFILLDNGGMFKHGLSFKQ